MYRPKHFDVGDRERLHGLLREQPFGTLVSHGPAGIEASHIPFLLDADRGSTGCLFGHVARANPQWQTFDGIAEALVIFQGPHAYVSPAWMESEAAVPTWNYVAVHVSGRPRVIEEPDRVRRGIERLVRAQEASRPTPWTAERAPAEFVDGMLRGIVAFDLPIERIEGKWKLSQNRSDADRRGVIAGLTAEGGEGAAEVAKRMSEALD